jgi:isoleucyl-tRNA synthetase
VHRDARVRDAVTASAALIADEINVKSVDAVADESSFVDVTVKPNFKTLGKRCGPKLKEIGAGLKTFGHDDVSRLESGDPVSLVGETLTLEDVILERKPKGDAAVASDGHVTVALDMHQSPALLREGVAREIISLLQTARKDAGLDITDRIAVTWGVEDPEVATALREFGDAISKEILAVEFREGGGASTLDVNKVIVRYSLEKRANE